MELLKNLFGYSKKGLEDVVIDDEIFLTDVKAHPKYVLSYAFGAGIDENSYNQTLARAVRASRKYFGEIPAIVQVEIGSCLERDGENNFHCVGRMYEKEEKSLVVSKVDTYGILSESKKILDSLELLYDSGIVIAHPYHMERVLRNAKKVGIKGKPFMKKEIEWAKSDPQPWVRSPYLWLPREIIARMLKK